MSNAYRDKLLSVGYLGHGRTRDRVKETRHEDGTRTKATTDQLGNTVTEWNTPDDRVDVMIRPETVKAKW